MYKRQVLICGKILLIAGNCGRREKQETEATLLLIEMCIRDRRNAVPGYDNVMSFMNASMDTLLVAQTFCTLAEEAGLCICYLGTTTYNPQMIIDTLQLPKLVFPITTITVGYPDGTPEMCIRDRSYSLLNAFCSCSLSERKMKSRCIPMRG